LVKLYEEFKNDSLVILAVDVQENRNTVERFVKKQKMPFPVLLDRDGSVAKNYGIRSHPAHFLIDRQGKIMGTALGARDWASDANRDLIRFLVAQK